MLDDKDTMAQTPFLINHLFKKNKSISYLVNLVSVAAEVVVVVLQSIRDRAI